MGGVDGKREPKWGEGVGGMGARALLGECCCGFGAEVLLGVGAHAGTASVFWRRWVRCWDFGEGEPGRALGSPFGRGVRRGTLVFVAPRGRQRRGWGKTGT